jgi:hypothetical protein
MVVTMAVTGRKPKPDGMKRNRMPPVHDWTEVPHRPYDGPRPALPTTRGRVSKIRGAADEFEVVRLRPETRRWWNVISRMPHCVLWADADWQFALETALVYDRFWCGEPGTAGELRQRAQRLGVTLDARRDLRIRYVDADAAPALVEQGAEVARVASLDDYRQLLADDGG